MRCGWLSTILFRELVPSQDRYGRQRHSPKAKLQLINGISILSASWTRAVVFAGDGVLVVDFDYYRPYEFILRKMGLTTTPRET